MFSRSIAAKIEDIFSIASPIFVDESSMSSMHYSATPWLCKVFRVVMTSLALRLNLEKRITRTW